MANGRGGGIFMIPPEYYGLYGLGKAAQDFGQTLEQRRAREQQEEFQRQQLEQGEREIELAESEQKAQERQRKFTRLREISKLYNLTPQGTMGLMQEFHQGLQTDPRLRPEDFVQDAQADALRTYAENPDQATPDQRALAKGLLGVTQAELGEVELDAKTTANALAGLELEEHQALGESLDALYTQMGRPELVGSGMSGLDALNQKKALEMGDARIQEAIARVGQIEAETDRSETLLPLEIMSMAAGIEREQAETDRTLALTPEEVKNLRARRGLTEAKTGLTEAEQERVGTETEFTRAQLDRFRNQTLYEMNDAYAKRLGEYAPSIPREDVVNYARDPESVDLLTRTALDEISTRMEANLRTQLKNKQFTQTQDMMLQWIDVLQRSQKLGLEGADTGLANKLTFAFMNSVVPGLITESKKQTLFGIDRLYKDTPAKVNWDALAQINPLINVVREEAGIGGDEDEDDLMKEAYEERAQKLIEDSGSVEGAIATLRLYESDDPGKRRARDGIMSVLETKLRLSREPDRRPPVKPPETREEPAGETETRETEAEEPTGGVSVTDAELLDQYRDIMELMEQASEGSTLIDPIREVVGKSFKRGDLAKQLVELRNRMSPEARKQADLLRRGG